MNKHILKMVDLVNVGFLVAIVTTLALLSLAMMMNLSNEGHQEIPLTRVENGGILELDALPESVELPNGVVLKDVSIGVAETCYIWERVPKLVERGDKKVVIYVDVLRETFPGDTDADVIKYGNQEMISGTATFPEGQRQETLKVTWLDNQQQKIGHTYALLDVSEDAGKVKFWALPGSKRMRVEIV